MPLTAEQIKARRNYIGSSDVAAILGYSKYRTAEDVRLSKLHELEDEKFSEPAWLGTMLQQGLIDGVAQRYGWQVDHDVQVAHPVHPFLVANLDAVGYAKGRQFVIEAKCIGLCNPMATYEEWGKPPDGEIPDEYLCQVQYQLAVSGLASAYVVALLGGAGLQVYRVQADPGWDRVVAHLARWWSVHVRGGNPCEPGSGVAEVAGRILRQRKCVPIDNDLAWRYVNAGIDQREQAKSDVLAALGDADEGLFEGGSLVVNKHYRETADMDLLRVSFPEAYEATVRRSPVVKIKHIAPGEPA